MTEDAMFKLGETLDAYLATYAMQGYDGARMIIGGHPIVTFMVFSLLSMITLARCCRTAKI